MTDAMNRVLTVANEAVSTEEFAEHYAASYLTAQGEIMAWRDRITDDAFKAACSDLSFCTLRMFMLPAVVHAQSELGNEAFAADARCIMNAFDAGATYSAAYMLVRYGGSIPTDADMRLLHAVRQIVLNARMSYNACSPALLSTIKSVVTQLRLSSCSFDEMCEREYRAHIETVKDAGLK